MTKMTYQAPTMRAHGQVEVLTKGGADGAETDKFFPSDTPKGELTFS